MSIHPVSHFHWPDVLRNLQSFFFFFQKAHEECVIPFANVCFCAFAYRSISEGLAGHLYRLSLAASPTSRVTLIFYGLLSVNPITRQKYSTPDPFSQHCIALTATCCWSLQISSFLQRPIKLPAKISSSKRLFTPSDAHLVLSTGCAPFLDNLVSVTESKDRSYVVVAPPSGFFLLYFSISAVCLLYFSISD